MDISMTSALSWIYCIDFFNNIYGECWFKTNGDWF